MPELPLPVFSGCPSSSSVNSMFLNALSAVSSSAIRRLTHHFKIAATTHQERLVLQRILSQKLSFWRDGDFRRDLDARSPWHKIFSED